MHRSMKLCVLDCKDVFGGSVDDDDDDEQAEERRIGSPLEGRAADQGRRS